MGLALQKNEVTGWTIGVLVSVFMILGAVFHKLPLDVTEVLGFVSGALTVWLIVKQNIWNWPIGIINNIFFIVLFWQAHLFADMGLQVIYIALSIFGWYWWLHGGKNKTKLQVARLPFKEALVLVGIAAAATFVMAEYLARINDAAPFLDALTTVMSLVAQYMLTRKYIENWAVWISVDVIYIYLYATRDLVLTSVLYFIFLCMCIAGLRQWQASIAARKEKVKLSLHPEGSV